MWGKEKWGMWIDSLSLCNHAKNGVAQNRGRRGRARGNAIDPGGQRLVRMRSIAPASQSIGAWPWGSPTALGRER